MSILYWCPAWKSNHGLKIQSSIHPLSFSFCPSCYFVTLFLYLFIYHATQLIHMSLISSFFPSFLHSFLCSLLPLFFLSFFRSSFLWHSFFVLLCSDHQHFSLFFFVTLIIGIHLIACRISEGFIISGMEINEPVSGFSDL